MTGRRDLAELGVWEEHFRRGNSVCKGSKQEDWVASLGPTGGGSGGDRRTRLGGGLRGGKVHGQRASTWRPVGAGGDGGRALLERLL